MLGKIMVLVLGSMFLLSTKMTFPGLNALYPCLGAALLLWPKSANTWMARGLSVAPMVFIGKISFSLYLLHWPLVVLYRHYGTGRMPDLSEALVLVVLCFVLAYLCWRFVEQPFRKQRKGRVFNVSVGAAVMCSVAALGVAVLGLKGLPERLPAEARTLEAYAKRSLVQQNGRSCWVGSKTPQRRFSVDACLTMSSDASNVLLLGDSHMMHFSKAFRDAYPHVNFMQITTAACTPVLPKKKGSKCDYFTRLGLKEFIKENTLDALVLSGKWNSRDVSKLNKVLKDAGRSVPRIVVLGPVVRYSAPLPELLAKSYMRQDSGAIVREASLHRGIRSVDRKMAEVVSKRGVEYYSVFNALCGSDNCEYVTPEGVPTHYDRGHLTYEGAAMVVERLKKKGLNF